MKVEIDGVLYVPIGSREADPGEAARSLLLAWTSGYYVNQTCGKTGNTLLGVEDTCSECEKCRLFKATVKLIGRNQFKRRREPIIEQILNT